MNRFPSRMRALLLVVPLCGALLVTSFARTSAPQDPKPPEGRGDKGGPPQDGPERPRGPRGERGGPNLHNSMEQLQRTLDQVQTTIADPAKSEETLVGLSRMVQFAGSSVTGQPKNLGEQPEDKKAAHKNAFRRESLMLTRQLVDIELLVLDGKHSEAADMLQKLPATRDAAHDKFGGHEDEGGKGGAKAPPDGPPKK